ncbi:hypothetical protein GDO86_017722 [Hymenochirus boettgeri]|uniref:G-protein coupled receptors family 1 profile domain-containing protein n=1 Tax=Hymenochirus boettgeri TaxID=247094 RepID=A0A8T2IP08_9PIPI|nr:hypothetical protein GDO86_017722 [Hymenochirus boettgeri]
MTEINHKFPKNQTTLSEILLLGFQSLGSYRFLLFPTFIVIYVLILSGNFLVILVIVSNKTLHSPMYFFLCNLFISEILCTTNIIPILLQVLLKNGVTISLYGCFTQFSFFSILVATESLLLIVMSYDRYLAICRPLHYHSIMHFWNCCYLSLACWTTSSLIVAIPLVYILKLDICGKAKSILNIQSVTGKKKAFSTCSSHLSVVSTYYITLYMVYLVPSSGRSSQVNKVLSLLYTIVTPLLNPFIYSLNNREIRATIALIIKGQISPKTGFV